MDSALPPKPSTTPRHKTRWRDTLYARATVFLLVGGGALVGALVAMSARLVDESVERLLVERLDLVTTVGGLLELRLEAELSHLADRVEPLLSADGSLGEDAREAAREALAAEYPHTVFTEGALLLDGRGQPLIALPSGPAQLQRVLDLPALARRAAARGGTVVSSLVRLDVGDRPVLVALRALSAPTGTPREFIAGVLQPAAADLLSDVRDSRPRAETELDLFDANGVVVASTDKTALYRMGDHDATLRAAITAARPLKSRCHRCHDAHADEPQETLVMAFAPLPHLRLGLAVYQPESEALAPAFDLREQLTMVIAVVALFVLFIGFAVHSVVKPVVRLTRAIDTLDAEDSDRALPHFGDDEVGTLARSLDHWRQRMHRAMRALEDSRRAARDKAEETRLHLDALEEIAAQSSMGDDVEAILTTGLGYLLKAVQLDVGALSLRWEDASHEVTLGLSPERAAPLLDAAHGVKLDAMSRKITPAGAGHCAVQTVHADRLSALGDDEIQTLALSSLLAPHGMRIHAVMASSRAHGEVEKRWIHSLFYHICMSATSRILRDREQQRQRKQERYLRGVLNAQEEERRRIARDLHDTIAQDLAALRLDLERLGGQLEGAAAVEAVRALEAHTATILRTTRQILLDLRLTVLESVGFVATLQWHLERVQREHGVRGVLSVDGEERQLDYYLSVALLRIFQECLNNVVQHAEAEQVFVTVSFGDAAIGLEVEDDGRGLSDPQGDEHAGLGILGMRERARLLGGRLVITSQPGEGTTVTVTVPSRPATPDTPAGQEGV